MCLPTGISGCNLAYFDMQQNTVFSVSNVAGLIWVSPAILSLFGHEIGQGASRDWNVNAFAKSLKSHV